MDHQIIPLFPQRNDTFFQDYIAVFYSFPSHKHGKGFLCPFIKRETLNALNRVFSVSVTVSDTPVR